jgi:transposase
VKQVDVPWARSGSGFTLLFEALVMTLAREMPVAAVASVIGEHDTRVWRIIHHYVDKAREESDFSEVKKVAVDETASRRGHNYISLYFDVEAKKLLLGVEGRDQKTVEAFSEDLRRHGGDPDSIEQICCDMSPAYIAGINAHLPNAETTFDRFHIMKIMNDAVDRVRREEARETDLLKRTRYYWLKNPENLTAAQRRKIASLTKHNLKTSRAYQIRLTLREFFEQPNRAAGEDFLKRWYFWATHSRLQPVIEAARTIKRHWEGVLNWFDSRLTTGLLEGFNSLIQAAKARARGYRTNRNLITMAYLIGGKLNYALPT